MCVILGIKIAESCHIRYGRILLRVCTVRTSVSCYFRNVQIVRRANYTSSLYCEQNFALLFVQLSALGGTSGNETGVDPVLINPSIM